MNVGNVLPSVNQVPSTKTTTPLNGSISISHGTSSSCFTCLSSNQQRRIEPKKSVWRAVNNNDFRRCSTLVSTSATRTESLNRHHYSNRAKSIFERNSYYVFIVVIFFLFVYMCQTPPRSGVLAFEHQQQQQQQQTVAAKLKAATDSGVKKISASPPLFFPTESGHSSGGGRSSSSGSGAGAGGGVVNILADSFSQLNWQSRSTTSSLIEPPPAAGPPPSPLSAAAAAAAAVVASSSSHRTEPQAEHQTRWPPFTILALLPGEQAPLITRALRDGQSKWEISGHKSTYWKKNHSMPSIGASDLQLTVYSEPTQNDTERILSSTCEWIQVYKPALVLSLMDRQRSFYAAMVAESAGIPFVSMTQHYQNEVDPIMLTTKTSATAAAVVSSPADNKWNTNNKMANGKRLEEKKNEPIMNSEYWIPSSFRLSLDPPIETLADATFELLRTQYWFDALLIIDESIVSDLFARRLSSLCDSLRRSYEQSERKFQKRQNFNQKFNKLKMNDGDRYPWSSSAYDTFTWMDLQRSSVKKSSLLADTLLLSPVTESDDNDHEEPENNGDDNDDDGDTDDNDELLDFSHQAADAGKSSEKIGRQHSKAGLLMSIWKNLMIIRISQSLDHKEFYLRMAEIQNTHRRVVLVHCDKSTTERVLLTGRELDLFNGEKIWILLDGLLAPDEKFDTSDSDKNFLRLMPNGMLALQNRRRHIYDPESVDSIVQLMGKAALNSYQKRIISGNLRSNRRRKKYAAKNKPFRFQHNINNNNNNKPMSPPSPSALPKNGQQKTVFSPSSSSSSSSSASYPSPPPPPAPSSLPRTSFNVASSLLEDEENIVNDYYDDDDDEMDSAFSSSYSGEVSVFPLDSMAQISTPSSSSSSSTTTDSCTAALNYTGKQIEHRIDILRELRKLMNPVLARYRSKSRCISSRSRLSNKHNAWARLSKNGKKRNNGNGNFASSAPGANGDAAVASVAAINHHLYPQWKPTHGQSVSNFQKVKSSSSNTDKLLFSPGDGMDFQNYHRNYDDYDDDDDDDDDVANHDTVYANEDDVANQDIYRSIVPQFDLLNLVSSNDDDNENDDEDDGGRSVWRVVGNITRHQANVNTIMYIGADQLPKYIMHADGDDPLPMQKWPKMANTGKHRFRVVTNIAPPFVIESTKLDNNTCLIGDFCLKVFTNVRDDLIAIFTDFRSQRRQDEGKTYQVHCCSGIAIDLLNAVSRDLHFDYDLYLVADGLFGIRKDGKWDGVTADLVNDVAHLSFTAFSTTSSRVQAIDYSVPFFYSGVSCLSSVSSYSDVRLLAFLIPFSYELWAAIFASLVATAIAAAIYEWFSPFGLNPWGRQRTKNFSLASALWVMCSLLFSHLVAFKAPKSWPNKVLINVWGAFSVIFLATYTANIAAHFAGFLLPEVNDFHDTSLMQQRTGTARSSASEGYLMEKYTELWHHIQRYKVDSFDAGLESLRNDKLDVLIGDTAILDYYRANDPGCNLRLLGDSIFDDAYAVGMPKGFPFRESISNLILKYNEYGFLDQLHRKWYGRVHCLESTSLSKPEPLTVRGVAGVFLMLTIGIMVGILILLAEHLAFKYLLPSLRKKPKDCFWKSPNLMFFSQKLYRFINTVELVSPHHSAKEIITNLREGQIASLFQKSVKRKAKEEARRRKSKSQFFEMIQEVRKVVHLQQTERSLQQDDEEDEDIDSDIDEEAAINTNANIRATRPSFSSVASKDETLEMEICQNRVSAIRFREPNDTGANNTVNIHHPPNPMELMHRKLPSSLKSSTDSSGGSHRGGTRRSALASSTDDSQDIEDRTRVHHHHHRKRKLSHSVSSTKSTETTQTRRKKLQHSHLSSTSFSLEDIFFEGILSEGISGPAEKKKNIKKRRTLSFEDLPAIKKELSESSNEDYGGDLVESEQYGRYTMAKGRRIKSGPRHQSSLDSRLTATSTGTDDPFAKMSHQEIVDMWNSSERELLDRLQNVMQQKRALEEKVALLQRMLQKPP